MSRPVIELVYGPHDGERREDNPDNPLLAVICCLAHRYVWDGLPAVLHPDDTAVRRFLLVKETK